MRIVGFEEWKALDCMHAGGTPAGQSIMTLRTTERSRSAKYVNACCFYCYRVAVCNESMLMLTSKMAWHCHHDVSASSAYTHSDLRIAISF